MKKTLTILLSCGLALTVLSACGHTHTAAEGWDRNGKEHWQVCTECGEKMEVAAHELDDMGHCEDCNSDIWDFGDSFDVQTWDEKGNLIRNSSYDQEGNLLSDTSYKFTYDENDNLLFEKIYDGDTLREETEYATGEDGEPRSVKYIYYDEDGSKTVNAYDENGEIISMLVYDAEGNLTHEEYSEYALDDEGESYECKATITYEDGTKYVAEYTQYGDLITRVKYNAEGELEFEERYEREYNEEGQMLWEKTYHNGMLTEEIVSYAVSSDGDYTIRYPEQVIEYYEDGTKIVFYYNTNADMDKEVYYKADGSVKFTLTYVYDIVDDGEWDVEEHGIWNHFSIYKDGVLYSETKRNVSEEGWGTYEAQMIQYHEDGTKTVTEFDESGEVVSEIDYDAAGNVIEK